LNLRHWCLAEHKNLRSALARHLDCCHRTGERQCA
jgi:hypothetical protein